MVNLMFKEYGEKKTAFMSQIVYEMGFGLTTEAYTTVVKDKNGVFACRCEILCLNPGDIVEYGQKAFPIVRSTGLPGWTIPVSKCLVLETL